MLSQIKTLQNWNTFFTLPYIQLELNKINDFLIKEHNEFDEYFDIFPYENEIFNCFKLTDLNNIKVVILGQDPYIKKFTIDNIITPQAMGLSFSVKSGISLPPSLDNIFKELVNDINCEYPDCGDLTQWAKQGVFLLNCSLTVRESSSNSHKKIWKTFSENVIKYISDNTENVVFLLWGNDAKKNKKFINIDKHLILESGHPSPLSANKGYWFGNKHFSKTNIYLEKHNKTRIIWN